MSFMRKMRKKAKEEKQIQTYLQAQQQQLHVMVGCIDADNAASIQLHQKLGFTHSGTIQQAGFKFDRWLDAAFYQLTLTTPLHPQDG